MDLSNLDSLPTALQSAATFQNLVAGQVLFHEREPAQAIFAVAVGRFRLVRYTSEGQLVIFQVVRAAESFGESALFLDTYNCNAIAEVPSRAIAYPKQVLLSVLQERPDLAISFMERFERKIQWLKSLIELRSIRSARERILQYLLTLARPSATTLTFDRPLKNVASELGLSPEVLYRTLAQMEREGILTRARGQIILRTPPT
ncbi:Crp/Fnr family transcriptional regulator [Scytonema sp. NUACC26]|uniref:Crp/Fnr family transcriptional regulator n=1 Tax=Scytonema sp. NUACC26 TaxID=3140176 RepID=UPI0034DBE96A